MQRVLFLVKYREGYDGSCGYDGTPQSYGGLYHSALFVVQMLRAAGVQAKLVQVCDNNDIDREVDAFKPDIVVIEALWVVPSKFEILSQLHPSVLWIVRCHSEMPFIAYEGVAVEWMKSYVKHPSVCIASNSSYGARDFQTVVGDEFADKILCLPNYYPVGEMTRKTPDGYLDIGCFGVLRPLKNQLMQALAAIEFAKRKELPLRFHINSRCEQQGDAVLKNLRSLFDSPDRQLIEHGWETREEFLKSLSQTDIGMQVSFSETFDITAADTVSLGIPLVTSHEVVWSCEVSQASPTNIASIVKKLNLVTGTFRTWSRRANLRRLRAFCASSKEAWLNAIQ